MTTNAYYCSLPSFPPRPVPPAPRPPLSRFTPAAKMGYYDWVFAIGVTFALFDAMGCGANDVANA